MIVFNINLTFELNYIKLIRIPENESGKKEKK